MTGSSEPYPSKRCRLYEVLCQGRVGYGPERAGWRQQPKSKKSPAQLSEVAGFAFLMTGPTTGYRRRCAARSASAQSGSGKQWCSAKATNGAVVRGIAAAV